MNSRIKEALSTVAEENIVKVTKSPDGIWGHVQEGETMIPR